MKINPLTTSILVFIIIMSSIALALPPIPTKWWGSVSINGSLVTEGEVRAYINGTFSVNTSIVGEGLYAIDVPCLSGDIVVLRFGEILTTGELACSPGDHFELNFTNCTTPCGVHEICNITDDQCYTAPRCADGTYYSECSSDKPKYCADGTLIDRCNVCGCPSGQTCGSDNSCFTPGGAPSGPGGGAPGGGAPSGPVTPTEEEAEEEIPPIGREEISPAGEEITPTEGEVEEVAPAGPTPFFLLSTTDWLIGIISGIIIALIIIFLAKRRKKKK